MSTNLVNVDAVVTDDDGNFLRDLKKENFRILEDGKPQIITNFTPSGEAPITIVMLLQFRANMETENFIAMVARSWAPEFLRNVKTNDWIALKDFDLHTRVDVDFTHDPNEICGSFATCKSRCSARRASLMRCRNDLTAPGCTGQEGNSADGFRIDTFSKHTLDKTLKTSPVRCVHLRHRPDSDLSECHLVADWQCRDSQTFNQLRAFSELTGGQAWNPNLDGEVPGIMRTIAASLRNQYSLVRSSGRVRSTGNITRSKWNWMRDGTPFVLNDQKGKKKKFVVYAREGYTAAAKPVD